MRKNQLSLGILVLNVIRMIKLFGWESRIAGQIEERREAELKLLRKNKWISVAVGLTKYV